jgi:hypothetical protein
MKLRFSLAFLLSALVLASSASAAWTQSVGGVASVAANGGTSGASGAAIYDDTGSVSFGGHTYQNTLDEYVGVTASVLSGNIGSASASWDTGGPSAFLQPFSNGYISTSLDGVVSVNVAKTSSYGWATASASMEAESGATLANNVGTHTDLAGSMSLTGVGSALASVAGATAKADARLIDSSSNTPLIRFSTANSAGDIKLTASNKDDVVQAVNGGRASGNANIGADSNAQSTGAALSTTDETMVLHANRGQSFTGRSYADGYLNGQEVAESIWATGTVLNPGQVFTVDLESTSQINGMANALNIRDTADMNAYLRPYATTLTTGNARAGVDMKAVAQVTRDTPYSGNVKAQAEGYMPVATWQSTGAISGSLTPDLNRVAAISGSQGLSWDGLPAKNSGFGVGAWILNNYNAPQIASVEATQYASTEGAGAATATYDLVLQGMKTTTGTQNDAVGAFGGVANQRVAALNVEAPKAPLVTKDVTPTITNTNAIAWLVGDDSNPLPGAGKYSPTSMGILFGTNALQRTTELTYTQSNPA